MTYLSIFNFDTRTLFDLSLRDAIYRYLKRLGILLIVCSTSLLPLVLKFIRKLLEFNLTLYVPATIVFVSSIIMLYSVHQRLHKKHSFIYKNMYIEHNLTYNNYFDLSLTNSPFYEQLKELSELIAMVSTMADSRREEEVQHGINVINSLLCNLRKINDPSVYQIIMILNRYHISLLFLNSEFDSAIKGLKSFVNYHSSLPIQILNRPDVRAEMARFHVTKATILLAIGRISPQKAASLLDLALIEFTKLKLDKEIHDTTTMKENIIKSRAL